MSVWIVSLITCAGNTLVLFWRFLSIKEDQVLSLYIKNLAMADLLMGIYLVAIGAQDITFRDRYNEFAHSWRKSNACVACGILAMISSEVSVLILVLITIERSFPEMDTYLQMISSLLEVRNTYVLKGHGSVTLYHPYLVRLIKDIADDREEVAESCTM
ncbi:relaxin receptor 2 [Trichonephila inaurata madagascariensis]|uniref:Relaxin receptor 2 n=1 Tax=Trichonephila inaurata madagascariensis TaxID=2747483 RepID=A0A8X6YT27_9ARAC|nr:relaxin receptor 2 [Trichonephila inaurata madagascariensis]